MARVVPVMAVVTAVAVMGFERDASEYGVEGVATMRRSWSAHPLAYSKTILPRWPTTTTSEGTPASRRHWSRVASASVSASSQPRWVLPAAPTDTHHARASTAARLRDLHVTS
jgi:hypothetical protein